MANELQDAVSLIRRTVRQLGDTKSIEQACDAVLAATAHEAELKKSLDGLKAESAKLQQDVAASKAALVKLDGDRQAVEAKREAAKIELAEITAHVHGLKMRIAAV